MNFKTLISCSVLISLLYGDYIEASRRSDEDLDGVLSFLAGMPPVMVARAAQQMGMALETPADAPLKLPASSLFSPQDIMIQVINIEESYLVHLKDRKSEIEEHKRLTLDWIHGKIERGKLHYLKETYSFEGLKEVHASMWSQRKLRHEGLLLLTLLNEEDKELERHIPLAEGAVQEMKRFISQDEEILSQYILYLLKKYIVNRTCFYERRPPVGWPSTKPADYPGLTGYEKRAATTNINRGARFDYVIKLLYNALPYDVLNRELRSYLLAPSLYEYIQRDTVPDLREGIFAFLGRPDDPDTARDKDAIHVLQTKYMQNVRVLERQLDSLHDYLVKIAKEYKKVRKRKENLKMEPAGSQEEGNKMAEPAAAALREVPKFQEEGVVDKIAEPAAAAGAVDLGVQRPRQYKPPKKEGLSSRERRIQEMIMATAEERTPLSLSQKTLKPRNPITLQKDLAATYKLLHGQEKGIATWGDFINLIINGFGGRVVTNLGNGSIRWIEVPLLNQDAHEIISSLPLHEPHPGKEIGFELRQRIREYLEYWGLAPDQRYVVLP